MGMKHINFRIAFTRGIEGARKLAVSEMLYFFKEKEENNLKQM